MGFSKLLSFFQMRMNPFLNNSNVSLLRDVFEILNSIELLIMSIVYLEGYVDFHCAINYIVS